MRTQVTYLWVISSVLLLASGCQSFRDTLNNRSIDLFGLSRNSDQELDSDELLDPLGARDVDRLLVDDLAPSQIATTIKIRANGGADRETAQKHYDQGYELYQQGIRTLETQPDKNEHQDLFVEAANQFRLASSYWRESAIEEDSLYFEGESYFFADRYVQANRAFEKLIARYSGSKYLDMAENRRFAIAIYWLQLSEQSPMLALTDTKRPKAGLAREARRVLHRIRIDDPTGKLADDATLTLAKAFLQAKRYFEAADTLEDLRKNYPGSKHQFDAHMLELEARLLSYQGPDYDDQPLVKADEILKSIVKQFPKQSRENIEHLEQQSKRVQTMLADRDYGMARFFEKRGQNGAAKFHYKKIANRFRGTPVADQVAERLAEIEQKPDRPEQYAKWLVDLFPDPKKPKPVILAGNNEPIFN